jgi:hypothetical protein
MSARAESDRLALADRWAPWGLGGGYVVALLATMRGVGFVRDEGVYFEAAGRYVGWLGVLWRSLVAGRPGDALTDTVIERAFEYNAEHPVLMKMLSGISEHALHERLGLLSRSTALRLPAVLMAGLLVGLTYRLGREVVGRRAGLFAAAAVALLPRLFHDAHLACFDVPTAAVHVAVVHAYLRSLQEPTEDRRWRGLARWRFSLLTGVLFGVALATKHNALLLPAYLGAHYLLVHYDDLALVHEPRRGARIELPPLPAGLAAMVLVGPVLFVGHWPHLWHDTVARVGAYLTFHVNHVHYPVEYFGRVLDRPPFPWAFPFVMTAVTVPLPTLVLMALGLGRAALLEALITRKRPAPGDTAAQEPRRARLALALCGLLPIVVMAFPSVPRFGGVKHWYAAMPFLAILAGAELDRLVVWACDRVRAARGQLGAFAVVAVAALVPGALGIHLVHPYGIGFYNELVGSVRGAAELGMFRNFWGYTSRGQLERLNALVEPGGAVFFQRMTPECHDAYRREGLLRPDIGYAWRIEDASWATIHVQRTFDDDEYRIWNEWGTRAPVAGVYVDEVPMNLLYRRPRVARTNPDSAASPGAAGERGHGH